MTPERRERYAKSCVNIATVYLIYGDAERDEGEFYWWWARALWYLSRP